MRRKVNVVAEVEPEQPDAVAGPGLGAEASVGAIADMGVSVVTEKFVQACGEEAAGGTITGRSSRLALWHGFLISCWSLPPCIWAAWIQEPVQTRFVRAARPVDMPAAACHQCSAAALCCCRHARHQARRRARCVPATSAA